MNRHCTVFLVDDDEALRKATARLLESHGLNVRAFASAEEFLAAFDAQAPGCLLLDLRMPGQSGLELQQQLKELGSLLPVVFLTGHADVPTSVFAMKEGAVDFLEKPVAEDVLLAALTRAIEKDALVRQEELERSRLERRYASLTPREREVFAEVIAGQRNKQAAYALGIAERTIKLHRARVLEKMGALTLADLGRIAERLGLHKLP
jgi:FixJ family two-component response regulator